MKHLAVVFLFLLGGAFAAPLRLSIQDLKSGSLKPGEVQSITERISSEMLATGRYVVLDRANLEAVLNERDLKESEAAENSPATPPPAAMSADKILTGFIEKDGKAWLVGLKLIDVTTGEVEQAITQEYKGKLPKFLSKGIPEIVKKLTAPPDTAKAE